MLSKENGNSQIKITHIYKSTYGLGLLDGNKAEGCHGDIRIDTKDVTLHTHTGYIQASAAVDFWCTWVHIPSWVWGKPFRPLWTSPYVVALWKSGSGQHHRWRCSALPPVCRPWPTPWQQTLSTWRRQEMRPEHHTFKHLHQTQMHPQLKKEKLKWGLVEWDASRSEGLTRCCFADQDKQRKNHHPDGSSADSGNLH